jgi:hypothetical protein
VARGRVAVEEVGAVPLREVSALAVLRSGGRTRLLAVGDHTPEVAVADLGRLHADDAEGTSPLDASAWGVLDPRGFDGPQEHAPDAQLEAAACDIGGRVALLAEEPARVYVLDLDRRELLTSVRLDVSTIAELAEAWDAEPSSRGEGLLLLRGGHLVVAKEKRPAGLIEFGPEGDAPLGIDEDNLLGSRPFEVAPPGRLVALAWWPWPKGTGLDDLSDLAADPHGGVRLLSDRAGSIAGLGLPLRPGDVPATDGLVEIPRKALNDGKPEGLAVLDDGTLLVACDDKKAGRALLRLTPPS